MQFYALATDCESVCGVAALKSNADLPPASKMWPVICDASEMSRRFSCSAALLLRDEIKTAPVVALNHVQKFEKSGMIHKLPLASERAAASS
jgi:hypothetical protein